ncbi:hypothetical protein [Leptospira yasudae]|nr:hypothetical protein [Leptospira yasudae]
MGFIRIRSYGTIKDKTDYKILPKKSENSKDRVFKIEDLEYD